MDELDPKDEEVTEPDTVSIDEVADEEDGLADDDDDAVDTDTDEEEDESEEDEDEEEGGY
jgi:hypothetical protein